MLEAATDEFSDQHLVSMSNTVDIYKGTLRDGTETKIEVYKEKVSSEKRREFAEVCEMVFKLRHKNLVRVLGWCNSRNMRALVTEWIQGENVETWLSSSMALSWRRRLRVVLGVVEGICYLSDQWPEITFDLTTSSVLLSDDNQEPLISHFKIGDRNNLSTSKASSSSCKNQNLFKAIKAKSVVVVVVVLLQIYSTLDCFLWR